MPILVSTMGEKKLLDIPKIAAGTGHAMAHAVHGAFQEWGLENVAHAMCFNTTSSITGRLSRVSFWSCWLEGLFYTSYVAIMFWS